MANPQQRQVAENMGWVNKFQAILSGAKPRKTISRLHEPLWWLDGPILWEHFIQLLIEEPFAGAVLSLEAPSPDLEEFLGSDPYVGELDVPKDTLFPPTSVMQVRATSDKMQQLKQLLLVDGIVVSASIHAKVHDGRRMILEWHDADGDNGAALNGEIDEETAHAVAEALSTTVERIE